MTLSSLTLRQQQKCLPLKKTQIDDGLKAQERRFIGGSIPKKSKKLERVAPLIHDH